jgi:SH3 domain protein
MKPFLAILVFHLLLPAAVAAETMYLSDTIQINLRTGRGVEYKILAMLNSGQAVEVIEKGDQYTRVRIPNGMEGWVLSRYLTSTKPSALLLESLEKKHQELLLKIDETTKENSVLKADNKRIDEEISIRKSALSDLTRSYEMLKSDTAGFSKLQSSFDESVSQLKELKIRAGELEGEVKYLNQYKNMQWFLIGAGILFFGMVIGFSAKRQRKRSDRF